MKGGFQYLVNPLIGCNRDVLKEIENRFSVDPEFLVKYRRTKLLNRVLHEMARFDRIRYPSLKDKASMEYPPVFIIGHWRSGTSFLHDLLCRVYPAAYTTTYHATFPNNLFAFKGLIRFFMWVFMPRKRPTDAMKMHPDLPQEEEIALGQERLFSFYYWFYFPREAEQLADEFMYLYDPLSTRSINFLQHYREFIHRCQLNTGGEIFISKNPVNTARLAVLNDGFPGARFIYLKRDPYETLQSSVNFFQSLLRGISLQHYEEHKVDRFILDNYKRMISIYLEQKKLIPSENLIELSYEDLIQNPEKILSEVTGQLDLGVKADLENVKDYLAASKDFPLKKYQFSNDFLSDVNNTLGDLIGLQGYRLREANYEEQMKS
jgi:hypothetical protein